MAGTRFFNRKRAAIVLPALLGLGGVLVCVAGLEVYLLSLFLLVPFLVSLLASFIWSAEKDPSFGSCYVVSLQSLLLLSGLILLLAIDGLICMIMATPLIGVVALAGAWAGNVMASCRRGNTLAGLLFLTFPFAVGFEYSATDSEPDLRQVTTSVEIDAPIEVVWNTVIAFPKIEEPPSGIFRLGIAYPIEASIEGTGVGAIRSCTFSTGSFIEPITRWEEPHLLAFDVTENPPPMKEISPYGDLHATHLHGFMVSDRGQFALREQDGRTILEGTTWYSHRIAPQFYWGAISDEIIHRIHSRVLEHIRDHAEDVGR